MVNELKHTTLTASVLDEATWVGVGTHIFESQTKGDTLYASSTTQLSRLGIGATNKVLTVIGGVPTWQSTLAGLTLTSPTLTTPALGTPSAGVLTSCTGLPMTTGVTGTLAVANGGTGVTAKTGTVAVVLSTSPTLVTPTLSGTTTLGSTPIFDVGSGNAEIDTTGGYVGLILKSTQDSAGGSLIKLEHVSASPAAEDIVGWVGGYGKDSAGNDQAYASMRIMIESPTSGAEAGKIEWHTGVITAWNKAMTLSSAGGLWVDKYFEVTEVAAPGAGAANTARIYAVVDGGSLTDLAAVFQDGTVAIFAQETTPLDSPIFAQPSGVTVTRKMVKPHPGVIQFVEEYPDGKRFVMNELQYHDAEKIAANKGCEGSLPIGWEVTTLQERIDKQVGILDKQIDSVIENENKTLVEATEIMGRIEAIKPINEIQEKELEALKKRLESIPADIKRLNQEREELNEKKQTELARKS